MHKSFLAATTTAIVAMLLVTACADDDKQAAVGEKSQTSVTGKADNQGAEKAKVPAGKPAEQKVSAKDAGQNAPIMNEPVDFSTPESIAKTFENIREQAGARAVRRIEGAMGFIMTYDLGVARDEKRMYQRLNGKTPNEIIAMGTARR